MTPPPTSRVTAGRRPRVSMLTGCDPTAIYMIEQLRCEGLLDDVYRIVWTPTPPRKRSVLEKLGRIRPEAVVRRLEDELTERRFDTMLRDVSRELFGTVKPPEIDVTETIDAREVNSLGFAARLAERRPDILLVNGAPILQPRIFETATLSAINCHFGIAPHYRGSFTLFWPLYHHDYDNLGVTLHQLTSGLDAGPIVGHAYPSLAPGDREGTVMGKCARVATELFIDYVEAASQGKTDGVPQMAAGRLFRKRDRSGLHDARLWAERTLGLTEVPIRPSRRVLLLQ